MTQRQIHMLYMHAVSRIPHAPLTGSCDHRTLQMYYPTVGERTVALKIIARCSITQTPIGQWNIDNFAV